MNVNILCELVDNIRNLSIYATEGEFNIQPFIIIYLYAHGKLRLVEVKDIDELNNNSFVNDGVVVLYKDLSAAWEKGVITKEELEDYNTGIDAYALTFKVDENDKTDIIIKYAAIKTLEKLKEKEKFFNISDALFKLYNLLSHIPANKIRKFLYIILSSTLDFCFFCTTPLQDYYKIRNQKSCNELSRLLIELLNIDNKAKTYQIFNPFAGPSNFIQYLTENISYTANYVDASYLCLFEILSSVGKKKAILLPGDSNWLEQCEWNAIIIDKISLGYEIWKYIADVCYLNKKGVFLVENDALFEFNNRIKNGLEILEKKISHIVFLPKGLAIIKVSDVDKSNKQVMLFDETDDDNIDSNKIINDIKNRFNSYILTDKEYRSPDFVFGLNQILSKRERTKVINKDIDGILLSEILSQSSTIGHRFNSWTLNTYDANYSKFLPFYKLEKGTLYQISEQEAFGSDYSHVLSMDLFDKNKYQPKIICYNRFDYSLPFDEYAFDIKENSIDYNYLVYEMNQDYFINQIFPTKDKSSISVKGDLIKCYIKFPVANDSSTPLKRQLIYVNHEKLKFINELQLSYGYNIDKIKGGKKLKNKTTLKNGRYRIEKYLSSGGFGITYKALDCSNNKIVALKEFFYGTILRREENNNVFVPANKNKEHWNSLRNFMKEAMKIKELHSENIIKVFDVFDENNTCYYTMEYIDGNSLHDYVRNKESKRLSEDEAIKIIRKVANALSEMHNKDIYHLDVKPENIMIAKDGRVVLIDFGAAHCPKDTSHDNIYEIYRSNRYTAPDIPQSPYLLSPSYDIYSLGATLYYMLVGIDYTPEESRAGTNANRELVQICLPKGISKKTKECLMISLNDSKKNRPKSIKEFLEMLPV